MKMIDKSQAIQLMKTEYARLDGITGADTRAIALRVSGRMTSRFGCFSVKKRGMFAAPELSIAISARCLLDDAVFYDVIRHEYAHAVLYLRDPRRNHGHDAAWKALCRQIGCTPKASRPETVLTASALTKEQLRRRRIQ